MKIIKDYSSKTLIEAGIVGLCFGVIGNRIDLNSYGTFSVQMIKILIIFRVFFDGLALAGLGCLILGLLKKFFPKFWERVKEKLKSHFILSLCFLIWIPIIGWLFWYFGTEAERHQCDVCWTEPTAPQCWRYYCSDYLNN